ncbi:5-oxopent-3-ene-1,2,5-tricarboxylate decarboxylase [Citrobacter amalonaticus]|uniref:5-oxopent-3-ene-1,2,5-tricarboxylate decarboxylase n=1 Tax=Citrobacter amalonaticus TaxID=35703 RepID=A0A2S4RQV9_CITAM|nr:fumarylacetoacetate hydrolase family protein [Citrobacter amalonaticus]POT54646.1 5-oxopent-3-ene-1,2,5-tricarboxylate decarboxylase [Citrobacter amalonaticus]POT69554.1 5-oxopent-3-ene-1,2,5-tricarboxylate decarboxylase [Citrobacter amalonaticus]POU60365.1 5-oxopent-3-ene-1,2,5-tricarboxylate decarboxylase [Citrobacter amalonaticus]POV02660.1 5-oxopent-3-ene-1,2,5-tricarboxylate decarboxylase [Citrobacter amalonaticus]
MKLASFSINHVQHYGIIIEDGIIDLKKRFPHYSSLKYFLAHLGDIDHPRLYDRSADYALDEVTFLPVIPDPQKILCVGMNYQAKREEFNEESPAPTLFIRFADSQTGHRCPLIKPHLSEQFDYEGELAVIIGKAGRHIPTSAALEHVAGYSCYMDGSVRDWQHAWFTAGKNWPSTGSFGPWMVTADELADPQTLNIITRLNGKVVQEDNTAHMVRTIPELIAYISAFCPLQPGDVILTGSPGGVGKKRQPPLFLKPGDITEVEIEQIGCLINTVAEEVKRDS